MKKLFWAGVVAAAFCGMPALAADLPVKAPVRVAPAPMFSWTGFYVGGHVGGLWSDKTWTFLPDPSIIASPDPKGVMGGLQAGYNWQWDAWVFGIQGDVSWADASGTGQFSQPGAPVFAHSKIDLVSTLTGRVGYAAWQRSLFYVKGGAAWVHEKHWEQADPVTSGTVTQTRTGWTVGTGFEYALVQNWSVLLEYNYMDFGTKNLYIATFNDNFDVKQKVHVAKVGFNYRFGGTASP